MSRRLPRAALDEAGGARRSRPPGRSRRPAQARSSGSSRRRPSIQRSRARSSASSGSRVRGGSARRPRRGEVARQARRVACAARAPPCTRRRPRCRGSRPRPSRPGCAGRAGRRGEVGGLVPAVAGASSALDDAPVGVGGLVLVGSVPWRARARAGLDLELVPGDVVGGERQGLGQVGLEVGAVWPGTPNMRSSERSSSPAARGRSRRRARLRRASRAARAPPAGVAEGLHAERDAVDAARAQLARPPASTVSGLASMVTSARGRQAVEQPLERRGRISVGVPPPR